MALNKQPISLNFSKGVDTKTDPFQLPIGQFSALENSVFDISGRLTKRNGYGKLSTLPDSTSKLVTTFNGNLTAIGNKLEAYSSGTQTWVNRGNILPSDLSTLSVIRSNTNQSQSDAVVAPNGLMCAVYTDQDPSSLGSSIYKYVVLDSTTGQILAGPTQLSTADATYGTPRVFLLSNYFVILFTTHPAAYHLQYIAVSVNDPTNVTAPSDISTSYIPSSTLNFDAVVYSNKLYIAYNTTSGGQSVKVTYLSSSLGNPVSPVTFAGSIATMFSLAVDSTVPANPIVYVSFYDLAGTTGYTLAVDQSLNTILAPTQFISSGTVLNLASTATNGVLSVFYEVSNAYSYDSGIATHYVSTNTITVGGVVGTPSVLVRSVGLASKAFLLNGVSYFLSIYNSTYQPTYFLINGMGQVVTKLAYSNGSSYYTNGIPNITITSNVVQIPYLIKDLLQSINKTQGATVSAGVYSQTGVNLATITLGTSTVSTGEIGNNLNIGGGYVAAYDGILPTEQGFFLWPDSVEATITGSGGSVAQQQYYYQVTYEWTDNQGNLFRSAPSIPLSVNVATGGGSASVTLHIPTLRLTYKIANPVRIVVYRWSAGQQTYYQVTPINTPTLNSTTVDSVNFLDTLADSSIIGNNILYTTGGVVENIAPPAASLVTLFDNRAWLITAEDRNLLQYSKQVIESTPVEFSDLLTLYVAPATASQGSTGIMTAFAPMDDKLIVFKRNALGYISGKGPDNTGANNQYSDFTLITSVVGCTNQQSIVFMPRGLMFQSSKGIWLVGRDLSTEYIGAPVESYTQGANVQSAVNVPGTTQVRFTLDTGITLMYDYYYNQWGSFTQVPAVSSTIYQSLHTYINSSGQVFQETPSKYLDNTSPVLMRFVTGWINLAGLQGFERLYEILLLGKSISPFYLNLQLAYDYNPSPTQATRIDPENCVQRWGGENLWGSGSGWGGVDSSGNVFEARVFPIRQKCESFQVSVNEIYDSSCGTAAGEGLSLSGMNLLTGVKKGTRTSTAAKSFG